MVPSGVQWGPAPCKYNWRPGAKGRRPPRISSCAEGTPMTSVAPRQIDTSTVASRSLNQKPRATHYNHLVFWVALERRRSWPSPASTVSGHYLDDRASRARVRSAATSCHVPPWLARRGTSRHRWRPPHSQQRVDPPGGSALKPEPRTTAEHGCIHRGPAPTLLRTQIRHA